VISCSGDEPSKEGSAPRPFTGNRYHAGVSSGAFRTELSFLSGDRGGTLERRAVTASFDYRLDAETTLSGALGAGTGGFLIAGGQRWDILPGALIAGSFSRRLIEGRGFAPFVLFGITAGVSAAQIQAPPTASDPAPKARGFHALDLRAGLTVGKTFGGVVSPYGAVRLFGGPVFWQRESSTAIGGDRFHYQLAAGLVATLPRGVDLFAEASPFGERSVTAGGGVSF
jgi:hypothetical protein